MGKAELCIRMLQILNTGRTYKVSELAELLETNPRNIIEYKKELDTFAHEAGLGFYIDNIPGRYGGYRLNGNVVIPSLLFSNEEKESLIEAVNYLSSRNDFMKKKEFQVAVGKIFSRIVINGIQKEENMLVINRFPLSMSQEDIQYRYDILKAAIKAKKTAKFTYLTQKNVTKERIFDPYDLFMYNNAWFVIGWLHSENHPGIFWFKLNRIQEIELTDKRFVVWKYYNKNEFVDEFGFKSNGDWYHVEFIAYGNYAALCKERIYGKNQIVTPIDENSTKVSVDMQNQESIRVFVLGFGENITVLEPDWLKNDLVTIAKIIENKYK